METGIDKEKIEALKTAFLNYASEPAKFRLVVTGVILAIGFFVIFRPQSQKLQKVRAEQKKAQERALVSKELRHYVKEAGGYESRVPSKLDFGDWQDYVVGKLDAAGLKMRKLEPKKVQRAGTMKVVPLEVEAEGMFSEVVDFIDRMERGERLIRMNRLNLERGLENITLRCTVMGLVKVRGVKSKGSASRKKKDHG